MKTRNWTVEEALKYLKECRPQASPNEGFLEQLKLYQEMNYEINEDNPKVQELFKKNKPLMYSLKRGKKKFINSSKNNN